MDFYRTEVVPRRDALSKFPAWTMWPSIAGTILSSVGWILADPSDWLDGVGLLAAGLYFGVIFPASVRSRIARYQKELALLDDTTAG